MSLAPQIYAELAEHSYDRQGNMRDLVNKEVILEGQRFRVVECVDNPRSGYQGTIYQHVESGSVVVAHRGTEFERERWQDLIRTDGAMVLARTNSQSDDAIELTKRALDHSHRSSPDYGGRAPEVTTTGHSLGGTLAQISAHHFDLRGETFNAYGAASLDRRIPQGGDRMINHVTAADMVSSGSPHFGRVRVYAQQFEIDMLQRAGYANNDARLTDPRNSLSAAINGLGSHDMHYFLNKDGNGSPDRLVLANPRTRELAQAYAPMIEKYRDDVEGMRRGITNGTRGAPGLLMDGIDRIRGPLPAGEPARREEEEAGRRNQSGGRAAIDPSSERGGANVSQAEGCSQQDHVARLFAAAKSGDSEYIRTASQDLQSSPTGQAWQQRADSEAQQLAQREAAQQHSPQQQDMARHA